MTASTGTGGVRNLQGVAPLGGFIAGAAIVANRLCKLDTTEGQVIHTAAITDEVVGVAIGTYASADAGVELQTVGIAKLTAAAAISLGAQVMPDSGGAGKIATISGATALGCGIALQAAINAGDIIMVLLRPMVKSPASS